jgi:hypothetical protein
MDKLFKFELGDVVVDKGRAGREGKIIMYWEQCREPKARAKKSSSR